MSWGRQAEGSKRAVEQSELGQGSSSGGLSGKHGRHILSWPCEGAQPSQLTASPQLMKCHLHACASYSCGHSHSPVHCREEVPDCAATARPPFKLPVPSHTSHVSNCGPPHLANHTITRASAPVAGAGVHAATRPGLLHLQRHCAGVPAGHPAHRLRQLCK